MDFKGCLAQDGMVANFRLVLVGRQRRFVSALGRWQPYSTDKTFPGAVFKHCLEAEKPASLRAEELTFRRSGRRWRWGRLFSWLIIFYVAHRRRWWQWRFWAIINLLLLMYIEWKE